MVAYFRMLDKKLLKDFFEEPLPFGRWENTRLYKLAAKFEDAGKPAIDDMCVNEPAEEDGWLSPRVYHGMFKPPEESGQHKAVLESRGLTIMTIGIVFQ